ncbi:hypothetical protein [Actinomyces faecalis]|uniref:hypothetical protein n=1 Tax=Actinomyces faecalis TaxID=2722820 RepID=UPI001554447F|nr:hypothetical protein [Actinomyces faecalis]
MNTTSQPPDLPRMRFASETTDMRRLLTGEEIRVLRGAYLLPEPGLVGWQRRREVSLARAVAALHSHPSAICLTHESAALIHGFPVLRSEPDIHLAMRRHPRESGRRLTPVSYEEPGGPVTGRSVWIRRRVLPLMPDDVEVVSGLPVTSPLRTAMDCACDLPARQSLPIIDAVFMSLCQPDRYTRRCDGLGEEELRRRLMEGIEAQGRRHGIRRARAVVTIASAFAESPGESVLRWTACAAGLPSPVAQAHAPDEYSNRSYFLDLGWPQWRVGAEFDGYLKYDEPSAGRAEKHREMRLREEGWRIERFDWKHLGEPERCIERLRTLFPADVIAHTRPVRDLWL